MNWNTCTGKSAHATFLHIHFPVIFALLFTRKNRTTLPCVRTAEPPHLAFARKKPPRTLNFALLYRFRQRQATKQHHVVEKMGANSGKSTIFGGRVFVPAPYLISILPATCGNRKACFGAPPMTPRNKGYLRRQTTDYRRLARVCPCFSNKGAPSHKGAAPSTLVAFSVCGRRSESEQERRSAPMNASVIPSVRCCRCSEFNLRCGEDAR